MRDEDPLNPERQYLCDMIRSRYGHRLSDTDLEAVQDGVEGVVKAAAALRSAPLSNSDPPVLRFVPYRKEG